jgi:hypothetical protein
VVRTDVLALGSPGNSARPEVTRGSMRFHADRRASLPPRTGPDSGLANCRTGWLLPLHTGGGVGSVGMMTEPTSIMRARDSQGEGVRKLRLRADGRRPLAMNLRDTILLTRKLFELRDAARRAR